MLKAEIEIEKVMREATRQALTDLNRRFYRRHAASFSSTRQSPWKGWQRIIDLLFQTDRSKLRILDLGCGNARLADYVLHRCPLEVEYLGMDSSPALLDAAWRRHSDLDRTRAYFVEVDITTPSLPRHLGASRFDLVALFGVLHHIPGRQERSDLVQRAASLLAPGGLLALSCWRFTQNPRFPKMVVPWEEYCYSCRPLPFALNDLEAGDYLLSWSGDRLTPRYCHFATEQEISTLTSAVAHPCLDRFSADGKDGASNLYLVFGNHKP